MNVILKVIVGTLVALIMIALVIFATKTTQDYSVDKERKAKEVEANKRYDERRKNYYKKSNAFEITEEQKKNSMYYQMTQ